MLAAALLARRVCQRLQRVRRIHRAAEVLNVVPFGEPPAMYDVIIPKAFCAGQRHPNEAQRSQDAAEKPFFISAKDAISPTDCEMAKIHVSL